MLGRSGRTKQLRVMRKLLFTLMCLASTECLYGQKYTAERSFVRFFSQATLEDITADNTKGSSLFNADTREIVFSIPIQDFRFAKSLMKEHFNERYMESEKYPRSTFQGRVEGYDPEARGKRDATAVGVLTIHGQSREVRIPGTIERRGEGLVIKAKFVVRLEDYQITIPQILWQNIAEQVEVTVEFSYKPQ